MDKGRILSPIFIIIILEIPRFVNIKVPNSEKFLKLGCHTIAAVNSLFLCPPLSPYQNGKIYRSGYLI